MGRKGAGGRGGACAVLTPLQEAFCREYVVCESGKMAIVKAGYNQSGNAAEVQASENLRKPKIMSRIAQLRAQAAAPVLKQLTGRILSEHERRVRLSQIALEDKRDRVSAVDKLNLMDKLYSEGGQAQTTPSQTFIFNLDGQSLSARELYQRALGASRQELSPPRGAVDGLLVRDGTCTDAPEG